MFNRSLPTLLAAAVFCAFAPTADAAVVLLSGEATAEADARPDPTTLPAADFDTGTSGTLAANASAGDATPTIGFPFPSSAGGTGNVSFTITPEAGGDFAVSGSSSAGAFLQGPPEPGTENLAFGFAEGAITFSVGAEGASFVLEGVVDAGQNSLTPGGSDGVLVIRDTDGGGTVAGSVVSAVSPPGPPETVAATGVLGLGTYRLVILSGVWVSEFELLTGAAGSKGGSRSSVALTRFEVMALPEPAAALTLAAAGLPLLQRRRCAG